MAYVFKGRLCGFLCAECQEFLADDTVRLYRVRPDQDAVALAAASSKDTFVILDDDAVAAKRASLIAETQTDESGVFKFELDDKTYGGEAFEVDVYCKTVPHLPQGRKPPEPLQFSITTVQPAWRESEAGRIAGWEYCIPLRSWCGVRARFGAWTICGHLTLCDTKAPLPGMRVLAFDADWLQDDPLGSAITDGTGHFRIDYSADSFKKTPFSPILNIELVPGPDVYFHVETPGGSPLLSEPSSRGRQADRENAGPCLCVDLCVEKGAVPPPDEPHPVFTKVGDYDYQTQIDSAPAATGLTLSQSRAFFQTLLLNGLMSKKLNLNPLEYTFEVSELDGTGTPLGWVQVKKEWIAETVIGLLEWYDGADLSNPSYPTKYKYYAVNPANPDYLPVSFTGDGWIKMPQESDYFGAGSFWPNNDMIGLISQKIADPGWGSVDLTGLTAGVSSTSTGKPLVQDRHFGIRMWIREAGNPASASLAGTCRNIAIDNTLYDNISHHPDWAGWSESGALAVRMIDIQELVAAGCGKLTNQLTVLVTSAHPNLGTVTVYMDGPGGPYNFTVPGAGTADRFGTATPDGWTFASLPACAYVVFISVEVLLTNGHDVPVPIWDHIAFCKE
ncbi:MAG TPA: hypothetical protein VKD71_07955 [Gemmataceae bacterium]|nr:hypothetical protein [Gemmataceae bacterium]